MGKKHRGPSRGPSGAPSGAPSTKPALAQGANVLAQPDLVTPVTAKVSSAAQQVVEGAQGEDPIARLVAAHERIHEIDQRQIDMLRGLNEVAFKAGSYTVADVARAMLLVARDIADNEEPETLTDLETTLLGYLNGVVTYLEDVMAKNKVPEGAMAKIVSEMAVAATKKNQK